jgi:hypothetical protein
MSMRLVQLWSARAQHAVFRRISSNTLPRVPRIFLTAPHVATTLGLPHGQGG